eukprot:6456949-Amphidinium_carterae.1
MLLHAAETELAAHRVPPNPLLGLPKACVAVEKGLPLLEHFQGGLDENPVNSLFALDHRLAHSSGQTLVSSDATRDASCENLIIEKASEAPVSETVQLPVHHNKLQ